MAIAALPVDWLSWSVGGGLSMVFLWMISVPCARGHAEDAITE